MKSLKKILKRKSTARKGGLQQNGSSRSEGSKVSESASPDTPAFGGPLLAGETTTAAPSINSQSFASKPEDTNTVESAGNSHHLYNSSNGTDSAQKKMGPENPEKDKLLGSTVLHPDPRTTESEVLASQVDFGEPLHMTKAYNEIPVLEQTKLPRGGVSVETQAVGRVQFGIPPETIKDSMRLGIPVPQVYVVPVERFCREMGPALGVNLAEFEFPAYFNYFVNKKQCTLVVDSSEAEDNIRRVFGETLLGPAQFRDEDQTTTYEPEDFAPGYPKDQVPNFRKELHHFRIMPDGHELVIETLLHFRHFHSGLDVNDKLAVPPPSESADADELAENSEAADEKRVEEMYGGIEADEEYEIPEEAVPTDEKGVERREGKNPWTYSQAKSGDWSVVWPANATEEQKQKRSIPRVEIFKMPGGTEYIIHDVNKENHIVGKARVSGHVKVSESMSVDGFGGHSFLDDVLSEKEKKPTPPPDDRELTEQSEASHGLEEMFPQVSAPPTFHPPSFGVTVLGNSHGFDKSGSVSGYVLWINGRGVMIDPPPYSSATLEREGIRPRTIVGIILTHCHADHDAGAFQKVLTGTPVVVITTPTIYKSFIRKYAALSALSPALLRHSHRFKPAIIGQPLRFQGATFHFIYSLHTIPCVGFRVEWRGRSMVFTADHFNSPTGMQQLEESGVLSPERADDLRNLALQECDLILHEAGAPPIHTPLSVLLELPKEVKKRLYVVHTSTLPDDCELKAAPTGTKGTIRLDQLDEASRNQSGRSSKSTNASGEDEYDGAWNGLPEYDTIDDDSPVHYTPARHRQIHSSFANLELPPTSGARRGRNSVFYSPPGNVPMPPLVALRPASSTDAWFILNLLSAVPFVSSLSYTSTMELLETARVDAYRQSDVILPAARRSSFLCVVWEGTCSEVPTTSPTGLKTIKEHRTQRPPAVWHAGDWTGPIALQPDKSLSGDSSTSSTHDVVAVASEGVKVITVDFNSLHSILRNGSLLYRKYLDRQSHQEKAKKDSSPHQRHSSTTDKLLDDARKELNVLELLNCNSALRKLNAVQKRHLESLAEGPVSFQPGERLWKAGHPVDKAFVIVSGSASFVIPRLHKSSGSVASPTHGNEPDKHNMHIESLSEKLVKVADEEAASLSSMEHEDLKPAVKRGFSDSHNDDIERLKQGLVRRAVHVNTNAGIEQDSVASEDLSQVESHGDHESDTDGESSQYDYTFTDDADAGHRSKRGSVLRRRSSRARKANKVLGRLYNRRAFTGGLVFSRGHFLGDVSKMVAGLLSSDLADSDTDDGPAYGFGDQVEGADESIQDTIAGSTIPEEGERQQIVHSSTLTAGKDGCVVLVFPKSSLIPFLDQFPGLLLSLLGTQVVV